MDHRMDQVNEKNNFGIAQPMVGHQVLHMVRNMVPTWECNVFLWSDHRQQHRNAVEYHGPTMRKTQQKPYGWTMYG